MKITGYLLLFTGLAIIIFSVYSTYNIFVGKVVPPDLFSLVQKDTTLEEETKENLKLEEQVENILTEKIREIFPTEFLVRLLNLGSWTLLASILIFAGNQIAGLGIKLLRQ